MRRLASENTYRLPDGLIVPPFAICYEISKDGTTALIIAAREFEPRLENMKLCGSDYVDELTTDLVNSRGL
jgi:UDP:flavonoid glycosyltransferase YjiC (YdhE family)